MISIIIPIYNEEKYIAACLDSVLSCDYTHEAMEILLIDGMSTDRTREIVREYQNRYSHITLIDNPKKIVPVAMNLGIKEAKGEYIIRLDAHASYPKDYFSKLIAWHQKLNASNVGAVWETSVLNKTPTSCAIKKVLTHPFGIGNAFFRLGVNEVMEVDTVPFGCYKRDIFEKYGYYDERLARNQDIELNKRIVARGGKIYLVPDVKCTYYARETLKALAKNNFANGKWNILTAYYTGTLRSLSIRHFIPLLFVLSLLIPTIGAFFMPKLLWIGLLSLASYLTLVIIISLKLTTSSTTVIHLIIAFLTLHISYGAGSLWGVLTVMLKAIKGN